MTKLDIPNGTYRGCRTCQAPAMDPFPDTWSLDAVEEGPADGPVRTFITPHRDGCTAPLADPQPGIAVRVSGVYVVRCHFVAPGPGAPTWQVPHDTPDLPPVLGGQAARGAGYPYTRPAHFPDVTDDTR